MTKPLTHLMDAATRVGRGDLSALVPITSRDEVGLLTATFNDAVVRLRSLVQTEAEPDQLRELTEELKALAEVGRAVNSTMLGSSADASDHQALTAERSSRGPWPIE